MNNKPVYRQNRIDELLRDNRILKQLLHNQRTVIITAINNMINYIEEKNYLEVYCSLVLIKKVFDTEPKRDEYVG